MMKKICFVTMGNIYTVPYLNTYTKYIKGNYSVIYWDREDKNEIEGTNKYYRFHRDLSPNDKLSKILGYIQYRKFVKTILLKEKFDVVVFLQTWSAILMADIAKKYYANKFVVDIRDYTYEKNPVIYKIEESLFKNASACIISSEGYKDFLPPNDYKIVHNNRELPSEKVSEIRNRCKEKEKLNISFIGYVNYQEQHKKLLLNLKNDPRFHLSFVGTRALELEQFCKENEIHNVTLVDTFESSRILEYYENTDFVNNLYGNHTPTLDYALSNKLYFAAELHIPILTCPDTYMSEVSREHGFGLTIDVENPLIRDELWNYYCSIDWDLFDRNCTTFLEKVRCENAMSIGIIKALLAD